MVKRFFIGVAACILGFAAYAAASISVAAVLQFVVSIPFVGAILSFPSTPALYVMSLSLSSGAIASIMVCEKISKSNNIWLSRVIFYAYMAINGIVPSIREFSSSGFSDYFWATAIMSFIYMEHLFVAFSERNKRKDEEN